MKRILLLDGDVFAYQCALKHQTIIEWEPGQWSTSGDADAARAELDGTIESIKEDLEADEVIVAVSCPSRRYFRHTIWPAYKAGRSVPPVLIGEMKRHLIDAHSAKSKPHLEGDDVLGVLSTRPSKGEKIIVSPDKDMRTIPGLYTNLKRDTRGKIIIDDITEAEADRWHLRQTLTGDSTDGYPGCPGFGPDKAEEFLASPYVLEPYEYTLTRGKRKGTVETRHRKVHANTTWSGITSCFRAVGLTDDDALIQARCARILRWSEWDGAKQQPILWEPKL